MSTNPQEDVACSAVHPSLSQALMSAPCSTRNFTIVKLSSMHAYSTPVWLITYDHFGHSSTTFSYVDYTSGLAVFT